MFLPVYWPERLTIKPLIHALLIKEIIGKSNISRDTPYIFAANHNSHLDEFVIMPPVISATNRVTHFFADKEHWFHGKVYFWLLAKRFQAIPVERGKGRGDPALRKGLEKLRKGHNLIIYPEGTRGKEFSLGKGKVGVAKLALWSGKPVVPIGIWGTHLIMPKGKHSPHLKRMVIINIGEPLTFEESMGKDDDPYTLRNVTDVIMKEIEVLLNEAHSRA